MVLPTRLEAARRAGVGVDELEQAISRHELRTTSGYGPTRIAAVELDRWTAMRHKAAQGAQ
jgi:hypothetical protein